MTEVVGGGGALPLSGLDASALTWPYADRRLTVKTVDIHPHRRTSDNRRADSVPSRSLGSLLAQARSRWEATFAAIVAMTDLVSAVVAVGVGAAITPSEWRALPVGLLPILWLACVYLQRGYERRLLGSGAEEFRRVATSGVMLLAALALVAVAMRTPLSRTYVAVVVPITLGASLAARAAARRLLVSVRRRDRCLTDVVLVGHVSPVLNLAEQLQREPNAGLRVVGACVPSAIDHGRLASAGIEVLGDLHDAARVVRTTVAGAVAVTACAEMQGAALRQLAWDLEGTGADLIVAPGFLEITGPRIHLRPVAGLSLLHVEEPELAGGRRLMKAVIDLTGATLVCLLLAPLYVGVCIAVRATSEGPALFRQVRVGRNGKHFVVYKFRSMYIDADQRLAELRHLNDCGDGLLFKMRDDPRITRVGRWMRRYSLDELPQLFNVFRGEMSLVGPRPPLPDEVQQYGEAVHRRLLVKPGVTGLWQVSGRSDLTWDESVRLDLRYVENWSLMLDVLIMLKTLVAVVRGSGAY